MFEYQEYTVESGEFNNINNSHQKPQHSLNHHSSSTPSYNSSSTQQQAYLQLQLQHQQKHQNANYQQQQPAIDYDQQPYQQMQQQLPSGQPNSQPNSQPNGIPQTSAASQSTEHNDSELLHLLQELNSEYNSMSPDQVRQQLHMLIQREQAAVASRESRMKDIIQTKVREQYAVQLQQLKANFEHETIRFEKVLKDRAQGVIKSLQVKHLDRLINIVSQLRQIQSDLVMDGAGQEMMPDYNFRVKISTEVQNLISQVEGQMGELSKDEGNFEAITSMSAHQSMSQQQNQPGLINAASAMAAPNPGMSGVLSDQFNFFASNDELQRRIGMTPFNPNLRDQIMGLHPSSNGASNSNQIPLQGVPFGSRPPFVGAPSSYGGVTSGDAMPITSGSNILSPNTTPSQNIENGAVNLVSADNNHQPFVKVDDSSVQNPHLPRSKTTTSNSFNLAHNVQNGGGMPKLRFDYNLPKDFPFNDIPIEKAYSNDLQSHQRTSRGGVTSQQTISNHDVNPDDVLRTFTNSLHSGGTLGAIHSSLTYYKEALASKEWSNLSPSNAYQNYMFRKNLVGEIQKLAKEISRIPTEEAKLLADLSKSKLSQGGNGSRRRVFSSNQPTIAAGQAATGVGASQEARAGNGQMVTAEQIRHGVGFIGNNESSILMDLNRASIVAAQKEAEAAALRQQAKRIVDDSATRLEPVVQGYTDAPIHPQLMQPQHPGNTMHQIPQIGQQWTGEGRQHVADAEAALRDSCCVTYDGPAAPADAPTRDAATPSRNAADALQVGHAGGRSAHARTPLGHAADEQSSRPLNDDIDRYENAQIRSNSSLAGHRRHGSVVVGGSKKQVKLPVQTAGQSLPHDRTELSPKQVRASIAAKRKGQQMGFFSNDQAPAFADIELGRITQEKVFQQTASFAQQNREPLWMDESGDLQHSGNVFQQTAGPNMSQMRPQLTNRLGTGRRKGASSVSNHYPSIMNNKQNNTNNNNNHQRKTSVIAESTILDNRGRVINTGQGSSNQILNNQDSSQQQLYDDLSQGANYQSSKSALDGYSGMAMRNQSQFNKTIQLPGKQSGAKKQHARPVQTDDSRVSPLPAATTASGGPTKIVKMNIKKNQIRVAQGLPLKRDSIQVGGPASGQQSKSVSREGRLKVKLVNKGHNNNPPSIPTKENLIQISANLQKQTANGDGVSQNGQQSPRFSRNAQSRIVGATGPRKVNSGTQSLKVDTETAHTSTLRQKEFSPDEERSKSGVNSSMTTRTGAVNQSNGSRNNQQNPFRTSNNAVTSKEEQRKNEDLTKMHVTNNYFKDNRNSVIGNMKDARKESSDNDSRQGSVNRSNEFKIKKQHEKDSYQNRMNIKVQDAARQVTNTSQLSAGATSTGGVPIKLKRNIKVKPAATVAAPSHTIPHKTRLNDPRGSVEQSADHYSDREDSQTRPAQIFRRKARGGKLENRLVLSNQVHTNDEDDDAKQFSEIAENLKRSSNFDYNSHPRQKLGQYQDKPSFKNPSLGFRRQTVSQSRASSQQSHLDGRSAADESEQITGYRKSAGGVLGGKRKSMKSRQEGELAQSFGTERVTSDKNGFKSHKNHATTEESVPGKLRNGQSTQRPTGYKRPLASINNQEIGATARVESRSQPPISGIRQAQPSAVQAHVSPIPPPTIIDEAIRASPALSSDPKSTGLSSSKRPVVRKTGISFIPGKDQQPSDYNNIVKQEEDLNYESHCSQFSFHHAQAPANFQTKKPSTVSQINGAEEVSPYMTQQKVVQHKALTNGNILGNKRIIHIKRPSTNFSIITGSGTQNQNTSLVLNKTAFAQRAASRVEQSDDRDTLI